MGNQTSEESGIEELKRLSYEIENRGKEIAEDLGRARKSLERVKKIRAVRGVIGEIKVSLVQDALVSMGEFNILHQVDSLKQPQDLVNLRRIILETLNEVEKSLAVEDTSLIDAPALKKKLRVVSVLLELNFSFE